MRLSLLASNIIEVVIDDGHPPIAFSNSFETHFRSIGTSSANCPGSAAALPWALEYGSESTSASSSFVQPSASSSDLTDASYLRVSAHHASGS
jgi:hypothetical protein